MIPEIGHFALILALCTALLLGSVPLSGSFLRVPGWIAIARPAAFAQLLCMLIAYAALTYAFLTHDFSVAYVARNSNTALPVLYLISGVWGAHEGSLLLWALMLAIWSAAVACFSRDIPSAMVARILSVMGWVSVGFLSFLLFTSNPFERLWPAPSEGRDLNPLLQDPGLAMHPPMLYMGYVGFSVAFAFAIAALLNGRLDAAWARWSRPWTHIAWMFLTLGITLGSWWAYYELGWGGWWFWDPVENASFMPWLVGTALIHSLAATEKRGVFKTWTVLLAICAFSLSLLGTFLVRSGVLTSVHAFASDPARGLFILVFLSLVVGSSLLLYALKAPAIKSAASFDWVSRETLLLINNVLLVVTAASILLGTLYPLIIDALGLGKLSVGPPYFNAIFIPLTAPLAFLVGIGVGLRWKRDDWRVWWRPLSVVAVVCVVVAALAIVLAAHFSWRALFGFSLALWCAALSTMALWQRLRNAHGGWRCPWRVPAGFYGMTLAHWGIACFVCGVTFTSVYSEERDVKLAPGETLELAGYTLRFHSVEPVRGPNYRADQGWFSVEKPQRVLAELYPQKRYYRADGNPMTEAAIDAGLFRDVFVALGDPLGGSGAWSVRVYYKAFIRWIWLGGIMMALGGLIAACDRRYRARHRESMA